MKKVQATLLFLQRSNEILLAMKKRRFGSGKWNGVGGKLDLGETIEQAMARETQEEIAVTPKVYEKFGEVVFDEFNDGEPEQMTVHMFKCTEWEGEPTESEEMAPKWFAIDEIPFDNMFPDDKFWFPLFLAGQKFTAKFKFDENWNMIEQKITEIDEF